MFEDWDLAPIHSLGPRGLRPIGGRGGGGGGGLGLLIVTLVTCTW